MQCRNYQNFYSFVIIIMVEATSDFISLKGITKTYGGKMTEPVYALRGVDLDIHDGDFISIM